MIKILIIGNTSYVMAKRDREKRTIGRRREKENERERERERENVKEKERERDTSS